MTLSLHTLVVIDFEASGLGACSWPIEAGVAWVEGGNIRTWSSLIRPETDWDMAAWMADAEAIHGIALEDLVQAPPAREVARTARELIGERRAVSDAPGFDETWARRLFGAAQIPAPMMLDFDVVAAILCNPSSQALRAVFEYLEDKRTPHRAGPDAERLIAALREGISVKEAKRA